MTRLADTLQSIVKLLPERRPFALVGGLAVSVRAEPRFTRDIDLVIAMKLVSEDPRRRPRDRQDLVDLAAVADDSEWKRATAAVQLVVQRGFSRGRDLLATLQELRALPCGESVE